MMNIQINTAAKLMENSLTVLFSGTVMEILHVSCDQVLVDFKSNSGSTYHMTNPWYVCTMRGTVLVTTIDFTTAINIVSYPRCQQL